MPKKSEYPESSFLHQFWLAVFQKRGLFQTFRLPTFFKVNIADKQRSIGMNRIHPIAHCSKQSLSCIETKIGLYRELCKLDRKYFLCLALFCARRYWHCRVMMPPLRVAVCFKVIDHHRCRAKNGFLCKDTILVLHFIAGSWDLVPTLS